MTGPRRYRIEAIKTEMCARGDYSGRGLIEWEKAKFAMSHAQCSRDVNLASRELTDGIDVDHKHLTHLLMLDDIATNPVAMAKDKIAAARAFAAATGKHTKKLIIQGQDESLKELAQVRAKLLQNDKIREALLTADEEELKEELNANPPPDSSTIQPGCQSEDLPNPTPRSLSPTSLPQSPDQS